MGDIKETSSFVLPDKILKVNYIKQRKGMAAGDHITDDHVISGGLLDTAVISYVVPRNRTGKGLVNPLTNEEKVTLEDMLGVKLSVYNDYWINANVELRKQEITLDLNDPNDYIQMAILRTNTEEICFGLENKTKKLTYRFVITEEGEDVTESKKLLDFKGEAWKEYYRISDEKELLIGVLKLLTNNVISPNSKLPWVQGKVQAIVDEQPKTFLNVIKDASFETKLFINKAADRKIITKVGNKYGTIDGLELCEAGELPSFDNAVRFLDSIQHQDIRDLIEGRMNEFDRPEAPTKVEKAEKKETKKIK